MTERRNPEAEGLAPDDERWVRVVRELHAPRPLSAAERVAFRERLDQRLGARRQRPFSWAASPLAAGVAAGSLALALLWLARPSSDPIVPGLAPATSEGRIVPERAASAGTEEPPSDEAVTAREPAVEVAIATAVEGAGDASSEVSDEAVSPEEALLALGTIESEIDESLPDEFAAIESLFLGS